MGQHRKIFTTTTAKPLRKSIPKDFPYFFVEFGLDDGFAHIIEDEQAFSPTFGKEIIAGMLDMSHEKWRRKRYAGKGEAEIRTPKQMETEVAGFRTRFMPFDWTAT